MHRSIRVSSAVVATAALVFAAQACVQNDSDGAPGETVSESQQALSAPTVVRLGHILDSTAPLFPGDPPFSSTIWNTIAKDGYKLELISMGTHTGTHVSAPCHFITGATCIDQLPASAFVLPAYVLDVRCRVASDPDHADFKLSIQDVKDFEASIGKKIPNHAIVILFTGFQDKWGTPAYYDKAPGFSTDAVNWMVAKRGIASLGADTFGPDASTDPNFEGSTAIFTAGGTTFENLAGLEQLHTYGDTVIATPDRLKDGSGFPTSPIAILR